MIVNLEGVAIYNLSIKDKKVFYTIPSIQGMYSPWDTYSQFIEALAKSKDNHPVFLLD